jgi:predicted DNA-binding transcriptional regulator YafY
MRRADRLFRIIQILRARRMAITARELAERLEISERSVYRDIRDLMASGVPIDGAAGVGYVLRRGFDLPPLMFTHEEIEALVVGARLVMSWTDGKLARAAEQALEKMQTVLPPALSAKMSEVPLYAPDFNIPPSLTAAMAPLRLAIEQNRKVHSGYVRADGATSERSVHPLALFYWGAAWTLAAWCELRDNFRNFRLDRISGLTVLNETFQPEAGQVLEDFYRHMAEQEPFDASI